VLSTTASGWFDLRRRRRGTDGHARRSDLVAVAGGVSAQDPEARNVRFAIIGAYDARGCRASSIEAARASNWKGFCRAG
jgi:hypothetical protein